MVAEVLIFLLRINLVLGLAILVVLVLRGPARQAFGAHRAYAL
jgi:beta-lactamase regulating signal transducer with metallopeptidase domain